MADQRSLVKRTPGSVDRRIGLWIEVRGEADEEATVRALATRIFENPAHRAAYYAERDSDTALTDEVVIARDGSEELLTFEEFEHRFGELVEPPLEARSERDLRLCDDHGMVSDESIGSDVRDSSYRNRWNRLRADKGLDPYRGAPFTCTGRFMGGGGGLLRCTGPVHESSEDGDDA